MRTNYRNGHLPGRRFIGRRHAAVACVLVLVAGACGSDESTDSDSEPDATPREPSSGETSTDSSADSVAAPVTDADDPFADIRDQFVDFVEPEAGSGEGLRIGFINLDNSVPYHNSVGVGMEAAAEAAGAELVSCDAASKATQALQCAQSFAQQGLDGYINAQLEAGAAAGICDASGDMPVLSQDVLQEPCSETLYGVNNSFAGYLGGVALGNLMKTKNDCQYDAYVSMEAPVAGQLNTDRMDGYRTGFESICGEITNERVVDAFRIDTAQTAFRDVLTAIPDAGVIVVASVTDDAVLGSLAAAKTAGREDAIWAMGQGADPSSWCGISTNEHFYGSVAYFPEKWGQVAVTTLIKMINGETVPATQFIKNEVITADNVAENFDLSGC